MSIMTWMRRAKCKDCYFLLRYSKTGKQIRHKCNNLFSERYEKDQSLNDLVCDKWKLT